MNRQSLAWGVVGLLVLALLVYVGLDSRTGENSPEESSKVAVTPAPAIPAPIELNEPEVLFPELDSEDESLPVESGAPVFQSVQAARIIEAEGHSFQIPEITGDPAIISITPGILNTGTNTQVVGGGEVEDGVFLYNSVTTKVTENENGRVAMTISSKAYTVDVSGGVEELQNSESQLTGNPEIMLTIDGDSLTLDGEGESVILGGVFTIAPEISESEEEDSSETPEN